MVPVSIAETKNVSEMNTDVMAMTIVETDQTKTTAVSN